MILLTYFRADDIKSWVFTQKVSVIDLDDEAGAIVRTSHGAVTSTDRDRLFETEEEAREAEIEFYKREKSRIAEAYDKKIESLLARSAVVS
jgi:ribosomal protein S28E/S33